MKSKTFFCKNNFFNMSLDLLNIKKNEITVIELEDGLKVKVLNKKISTEVENYMGL